MIDYDPPFIIFPQQCSSGNRRPYILADRYNNQITIVYRHKIYG